MCMVGAKLCVRCEALRAWRLFLPHCEAFLEQLSTIEELEIINKKTKALRKLNLLIGGFY